MILLSLYLACLLLISTSLLLDISELLNESYHIALAGAARPIVGNRLFAPENRLKYANYSSPTAAIGRKVHILVFSVWVGSHPLARRPLNHQLYAEHHGYNFVHVHMNHSQFAALYNNTPYGWASVEVARLLLERLPVDYLFKLDVDCLFSQLSTPLEALLDPYEQYDLYTSQTEHSRFTQSHTWIVRNSAYARDFLFDWAGFREQQHCSDLAQEQGAYHIMIGLTMKWHYGEAVSAYDCDQWCNTGRSTYKHHHCVLDWYQDNGFGMEGNFSHPHVFLYPYPGDGQYISPDDGYTLQLLRSHPMPLSHFNQSQFQPLTVHPCKRNPYLRPSDVMNHLGLC